MNALDRLSKALNILLIWSATYPRRCLGLILALILLGSPFLKNLRFLFVADDLIESSFESYEGLRNIQENFDERNTVLLTYQANQQHLSLHELCALDLWIQQLAHGDFKIKKIFSATRLRQTYLTQKNIGFRLIAPIYECQASLDQSFDFPSGPWQGLIYSKNNPDISIELQLMETDSFHGSFDPSMVSDIKDNFNTFAKEHKLGGQTFWGGNGSFQLAMKQGLDIGNLLNIVLIILIIILFKFFYGTYISSFLYILTLVTTSTLLHIIIGYLNYPIDVLSNSLFIILTISCIEDFIFLSNFQLNNPNKTEWLSSFKKLIVPSFATSVTTVIGFSALTTSDLQIISRFGTLAAIGAILEWIMLFTLLPAILSLFFKQSSWVAKPNARLNSWLMGFGRYRPAKLLSVLALIIYPLCLGLMNNFSFQDNPENVFPEGHQIKIAGKMIEKNRGWKSTINLFFDNKLSTKEKEKILNRVTKYPLIVSYESLDKVKDYFLEPAQEQSSIKNYLEQQIDLAPDLKRLANNNQERAILYINSLNTKEIDNYEIFVSTICPNKECYLAGSLVSFNEFTKRVSKTLFSSLFTSIFYVVLVIVLFALMLGQGKKLIPIILSALWGPAFVFCYIALFENHITYITCIFASVLVGLAGDNALQYMFNTNRSKSLDESMDNCSTSTMQVSLVMLCLPLVLSLGVFVPMKILGLFFGIGTISNLFGDFWLLKGFINKTNKGKLLP